MPTTRPPYDYLRDPAAIYVESFATVRDHLGPLALPEHIQTLAERLVHTTGTPEIASVLAWHAEPLRSAASALAAGAPVLADCEMVRAGITARFLPEGVEVICTLNDPETPARAGRMATTRSAAAVDAWLPHMEGAVVAIGNAPTALFRLLELLHDGAPSPAVVFGFPVGFVGAAESKQALVDANLDVPFATVHGTRGGSALAAAAVNAGALVARERAAS